ncbi:MAG: hypothetical protein ACXIUQ_16025 [Cecembia sp.]
MHLKTEDLIRLELDYDSGVIPPPYSHMFKLKIGFGKNFLDTTLDLMYTDREELTEEEILDEGFTLKDDFHFHGEIPKVWEKPLKSLYAKSKWSNNKSNETGGIRLLAKDNQGKISRTVPLNQEDWQLFAQDYIQAIYESSKKERPLQIQYLIHENDKAIDIKLEVKFLLRKVEITTQGQTKEGDWEATKELLSYVFLPDYDYEKAREQKPKKPGQFIECGDGFWHEMGKGVINIDDSFDAVAKIKKGFQELL